MSVQAPAGPMFERSWRTIIVAVSPEGAIGLAGSIPWKHTGDLRRFKQLTWGGTVIMGRKTWESLPGRLAGRRNIVVSKSAPFKKTSTSPFEGAEACRSIAEALSDTTGAVWFIGGAQIYREAMGYADAIDVTYVPDRVTDPAAVLFPEIDEDIWEAGPLLAHELEEGLKRRTYIRWPRSPGARVGG